MRAGRTAILSLGLSHYRSWLAATIETDGADIALYGPNGAGKTNVLEAVSMLSPGRGLRRAATDELVRRPEDIGWKITAVIGGSQDQHEVSTAAEGDEATRRTVTIDDKAGAADGPGPTAARGLADARDGPALDRGGRRAAGAFWTASVSASSRPTARRRWPTRRRCAGATGY